jgi:hypothetical protein
MVLTKEDRIALLARAREVKAKKRVSAKDETEADEAEEDTPVINVPLPTPEIEPPTPKKKTGRKPKEVVPLPVPVEVVQIEDPVPKKRVVPNPKWLKQIKTEPEKVCCDKKLTKEEPLIEDKPQVVAEKIVIPPKKEIVKKRTPRASAPTRTLELTEPTPIEEVLEDVKNNNQKYLPKVRQAPPPPSAPISIRHQDIPIRIFDY